MVFLASASNVDNDLLRVWFDLSFLLALKRHRSSVGISTWFRGGTLLKLLPLRIGTAGHQPEDNGYDNARSSHGRLVAPEL